MISVSLMRGCINPEHQVAMVIKLCMVAPRILRWLSQMFGDLCTCSQVNNVPTPCNFGAPAGTW
jgi:hypothetical protein